MPISCTLIITTYNRPDALDAVLRSVEDQKILPNEVIVADDGSSEETAQCVKEWQSKFPCPLLHEWQEDDGFRAARIRNQAVTKASGDLLIFIDGDCLIRKNFIKNHLKLARKGYFTAGNRVLMGQEFTRRVLAEKLAVETWSPVVFQPSWLNRSWTLRTFPIGPLRRLTPSRWRGVKTCNLAVWAKAFQQVNGFDESYQGWGYEDSDLVIRLLNLGQKHLNGRFATTVMHLWHPENDRSQESANWQRLEQLMAGSKTLADQGINQHRELQ